jgi:hypothetical protein
MSADTAPLTKVDSAVDGLSASPPKEAARRRASSSATGVYNINDLGMCSPFDRARNPPHALGLPIIRAVNVVEYG